MAYSSSVKQVALFASGSGSNAQQIIEYFQDHNRIRVALIVTNNPKAFVVQRAKSFDIPFEILIKSEYEDGIYISQLMQQYNIDFIALVGYLKLIPSQLIKNFDRSIINIHPALLPKYGGKGMYGMHIHEKIVQNGEQISGITIHYVNQEYDKGEYIFQKSCNLVHGETSHEVQKKVQRLEHMYLAPIIEQII